MSSPDVIVIGSGVVGAAVALEAARHGASVTVLERDTATASGCSSGNAGVLAASQVAPLASPEAVREGMRLLTQRNGALSLNPRPATLPWLARFILASTPRRARTGAVVLAGLAAESAELHRTFSEHHDTGYAQNGFLSIFDTIARLDAAYAQAIPGTTRLSGEDACELCPQLAAPPAGALFDATAAHCDPKRFADATLAAGRELGVRVETGVEVLRVRRAAQGGASLWTTTGERPAGEIVIAAGAWSPRVAAELGVAVPIQGAKGYHVEFAANGDDAKVPAYFPQRRVVATPLEGRIRVSGMLQICGTDLSVHEGRLGVVTAQARELFRGLADRPVRRVWRGLRPCTPDGLPLVGRVPGVANVTLATGHGMWGLQLAPVTGRLVGDLLRGEPDLQRLHPLRAERFGRRARAYARAQ